MNFSLRPRTRRDVVLHFLIILALLALAVLGFFYVYLPWTTNHDKTVRVPNLAGMKLAEIETFLDERNLDYLVDDSTFDADKTPLTVYQQYPGPEEVVKQGRKIFISVYAVRPPMVKMPNLLGRSLTNAQGELESYGLKLGKIKYVPDLQQNAVLKQFTSGKQIPEGAQIPKGSSVDLEVGDGLGNQEFDVPGLNGQSYEEVSFTLSGMGLQMGTVIYQPRPGVEDGTVYKQKPEPGRKIRVGEMIDIWISGADPKEAPSSEDTTAETD